MDLDQLFKETDWTEERLAAAVGTNQSTINRLRRRKRTASLGLALRISRATDGQVKPADLPLSDRAATDLALLDGEAA